MRRLKRSPAENVATAELRKAILSGSLSPGTRLRQEELAERLGVSRMPVRQALSVLEREGLVKPDPWRGAIVAPFEPDVIRDLYAFRAILERSIAAMLAQRTDFDPTPFHELIIAGRNATVTGDLSRLMELDLRFHTRLYEAIGNRVLLEVMRGQWAHIRRMMAATLTPDGYRNRIWDEHAAILKAIETHDVEAAKSLAEAHITAAAVFVIKNVEDLMRRLRLESEAALDAAVGI